ncbi:glucosamine-6-phosphate deaminase [Halomonas piscis]|uniref:glucosamine-6-phosphate deaminase n=1 Tax=Halomonas piscis TaxID=3031727 RepID=UPI00289F6AEA|nr:glucosamine-6-phosphate deaminase [Halomonas piscis]
MYKIFETVDEVSRYTARRILNRVEHKPGAVLGLATGSTMEPVYEHLVQGVRQAQVNMSQLTTFNLDEYIGLGATHTQSYSHYMRRHLFDRLSLSEEKVHLPDGMSNHAEQACRAYSQAISALGGLDLQLLGIGSNGHIGFNEPHTSFASRTHVVELSEQTRIDNGRFFTDQAEVPTHAMTLGIQDILEAKEIMLVITGRHKADIVAKLFHSGVDEALPASALKRHHDATIVLDSEAAALLPHQGFNAKATAG